MELTITAGVAELRGDGVLVNSPQDALDIMMQAKTEGAHSLILHQKNMAPAFFDLKTGLAGEVLQKFVNYDMRAAFVGDFENVESDSLWSLIVECNRGKQCFFTQSVEEAMQRLG